MELKPGNIGVGIGIGIAVAAAGMSSGSYTAFRLVDTEPRLKAVIGMSGATPDHTNLAIPALAMIGTEDRTIGPKGNEAVRSYVRKHQGPAFLFELKNGGHYSFTYMFKINGNFGDGVGKGTRMGSNETFDFTPMERTNEAINSVSVAFCGMYLKGEKGYLPFLLANHWPDDLLWVAKGVAEATADDSARQLFVSLLRPGHAYEGNMKACPEMAEGSV